MELFYDSLMTEATKILICKMCAKRLEVPTEMKEHLSCSACGVEMKELKD